jgi:hypothetical protein
VKAKPDGVAPVTDPAGDRTRGVFAERARVVRRRFYVLALIWVAVGSLLYAIELVKVLAVHG